MQKPPPTVRTVDTRRFIEFAWNTLKSRQENRHHKPGVFPGARKDNSRHRPTRVEEPGGAWDADSAQKVVDETESGVEQPCPDERHCDPRRYDGKKVDCPEKGAAR